MTKWLALAALSVACLALTTATPVALTTEGATPAAVQAEPPAAVQPAAVQPAAVQPAAVQPAAVQPAAPAAADVAAVVQDQVNIQKRVDEFVPAPAAVAPPSIPAAIPAALPAIPQQFEQNQFKTKDQADGKTSLLHTGLGLKDEDKDLGIASLAFGGIGGFSDILGSSSSSDGSSSADDHDQNGKNMDGSSGKMKGSSSSSLESWYTSSANPVWHIGFGAGGGLALTDRVRRKNEMRDAAEDRADQWGKPEAENLIKFFVNHCKPMTDGKVETAFTEDKDPNAQLPKRVFKHIQILPFCVSTAAALPRMGGDITDVFSRDHKKAVESLQQAIDELVRDSKSPDKNAWESFLKKLNDSKHKVARGFDEIYKAVAADQQKFADNPNEIYRFVTIKHTCYLTGSGGWSNEMAICDEPEKGLSNPAQHSMHCCKNTHGGPGSHPLLEEYSGQYLEEQPARRVHVVDNQDLEEDEINMDTFSMDSNKNAGQMKVLEAMVREQPKRAIAYANAAQSFMSANFFTSLGAGLGMKGLMNGTGLGA